MGVLEILLPESFQWWHLILLFLAGLLGESFGSITGGGSIVMQPALLLTGVPLQSAIAIDNAAALGTEAGILSETHRSIRRYWRMIIFMFFPLMLGGIIGTWGLLNAPTGFIKPLMVIAVSFLLLRVYLPQRQRQFSQMRKYRYHFLFAFLLLIGAYNNLIGIGEGTFARLGIMLLFGLTFLQSHGLKTIATVPLRIYSLIVTGLAGLIVWPYLLVMSMGGFLAGKYATKHIKKVPEKYLRHGLAAIALFFIVYIVLFV